MEEAQILIVENESIIAEFIGVVLTRHGYRIAGVVASAEEAVATTLRLRPDLMLMDIMINGPHDGIIAAERIMERTDIPIIYLTAYGSGAVRARAEETKASAYLVKPFKSTTLITAIETALRGRGHDIALAGRDHAPRREV